MPFCRLCLKEKELLGKSHIIPEFMYKGLYNDKNWISKFCPDEIMNGKGHIQKIFSGEYESGILCADCDTKTIGHLYEDYASKIIYGSSLPDNIAPTCDHLKTPGGVQFSTCKNVDYTKFKLFLISILWKSNISSRPFFSEINLGLHGNKMREMILKGDPGEVDEYPVVFMSFLNEKSIPIDLIAQPRRIKTPEGHNAYFYIIDGLAYLFYVNARGHKLPEHVLFSTIGKNNSFTIIHIPPEQTWEIILGHFKIP